MGVPPFHPFIRKIPLQFQFVHLAAQGKAFVTLMRLAIRSPCANAPTEMYWKTTTEAQCRKEAEIRYYCQVS